MLFRSGNEDNGDLLQRAPCMHCYTQCPQPCSRPPQTHASARDSWTLRTSLGKVSCGITALLSWILVHMVLFVPSKSLFPQSCVSSGGSVVGLMVVFSKRTYAMPKSVAPRATVPVAVHCCPTPPQETLKHSLSQSLWVPWVLVHPRFV